MAARRMNGLEWVLLAALSVIWGGSFFFTEIGLQSFGPLTVVCGRVMIAAAALWLFVLARGLQIPKDLRTWLALVLMGFLNNAVPFGLISWGQVHIESGTASILNATTPLFAVILAHFLTTDEKLKVNKVAGILLGVGGVAILIGPQAVAGLGAVSLGQFAILGAALSYGFAGIFGRRLARLPPAVAAAGMLTCSSLMMLPAAFFFESPLASENWRVGPVAAVAAMALICTSLAYLIYFRILATAGATNLLLVTLLIPVSAMSLGVLFLGEVLTANALIGVALIGAGLVAVDGRAFQFFARRRSG